MSNRDEPRKKIRECDITVWQVTNLINTAVCWSEYFLDTLKEVPLLFDEKKI